MRFYCVLLGILLGNSLFAQSPQPPEFYGGSPERLWNPWEKVLPRYNFEKFNPNYTSSLPTQRKCSAVESEAVRNMLHAGTGLGQFEQWIDNSLQENQTKRKAITTHRIPVVIHILYSNETENISEEQILSQLAVLNEDYQRLNADTSQTSDEFKGVAADVGLEFVLARRAPDGSSCTGINRISVGGSPFIEKYFNEVIKPQTLWNPEKYLNIWVANLANGVLGFSQFPEASGLEGIPSNPGAALTDGVVINYNAFGTIGTVAPPFDKGRTATHEIGHWFGLRHIWGDGGCGEDDFCEDTPDTDRYTAGCPVSSSACDGQAAMSENFMDYTDDVCMNMFSGDQKKRVLAVLENSPRRKELLSSDALKPVNGPPLPDFFVEKNWGCAPFQTHFQDKTELISSRKWTFEGAKPLYSLDKEGEVLFEKAGIYSPKLLVRNGQGEKEKTSEKIYVLPSPIDLPQQWSFEDSLKDILTLPSAGNAHWQYTRKVSGKGEGAGALLFDNYRHNRTGDRAYFLLPPLNFASGKKTQLSFDVGYAGFHPQYQDTLGVYISNDCGNTFHAIYHRAAAELKTSSNKDSAFYPSPKEWRSEIIDLQDYDGTENVLIAFVNFSGYGNQLFIDNIAVNSEPLPLPEANFVVNSTEICVGDTVFFADKSTHSPSRWHWSFPQAQIAADSSEMPYTIYSKAGTYDVKLVVANRSGEAMVQKNAFIKVNPLPKVKIENLPQEICTGSELKLSASGAKKYEWKSYNVQSQKSSLTFKPQKDALISLKATDSLGCSVREQYSVRVKSPEQVKVTPSFAEICPGDTIPFVASGAETYLWKSDGKVIGEGAVFPLAPRIKSTFTVEAKTAAGCISEKKVEVNVAKKPNIEVSGLKKGLCEGEILTLKAKGGIAYIWQNQNEKQSLKGDSLRIAPHAKDIWLLTALNEVGCTDTQQLRFNLLPKPEVKLYPQQAPCLGQKIEVQAAGANSYNWINRSSGSLSGAEMTNHSTLSFTLNQKENLVVEGLSDKGCRDTAFLSLNPVEVQPLHIQADAKTFCKGQSVKLESDAKGEFQWFEEGNLIGKTPSISVKPQQITSYQIKGTDQNACPSQSEIVKLAPSAGEKPKADFALPVSICVGEVLKPVDMSANATHYTWRFEGGTPAVEHHFAPKISYSKAGKYDVFLAVEGCNGKDSLLRKDVLEVLPAPLVQIESDKNKLCLGEKVEIQLKGAASFQVSPAEVMNQWNGKSFVDFPERTTTYEVSGRGENGCMAVASVEIQVQNPEMALAFNVNAATLCKGDSLHLSANTDEKTSWKIGTQTFTGKEIHFIPEKEGKVQVQAKSPQGCVLSGEIPLTLRPAPSVKIQSDKKAIYPQLQATLRASGAVKYLWQGDSSLSNVTGETVVVSPSKEFTYTLTGKDEWGCVGKDSFTLAVVPAQKVEVQAEDASICAGGATRLFAEGGISYRWFPTIGLSDSIGNAVIASPEKTTTYTLIAQTACCGEVLRKITVEVKQSAAIRIEPAVPQICKGDSLKLRAVGVSKVLWGEGIPISAAKSAVVQVQPSQTTLYTVNGWDEMGCPTSGAVTVTVLSNQNARLSAPVMEICEGASIELQAQGGKTYRWVPSEGLEKSNGAVATVKPKGNATYKVVVADERGCRDTAWLKVNTRPLKAEFSASITEIDLADQAGIVKFVDKTEGAVRRTWSFGDGGYADQQQALHIYTQVGTYTATLTTSNGVCEAVSTRIIKVNNSSKLSDVLNQGGVQVSVVNDNRVNLSFVATREMTLTLSLYNAKEDMMLSGIIRPTIGQYVQDLDLSGLAAGTYTLELSDGQKEWRKPIEIK